jgi:hypothetical protein
MKKIFFTSALIIVIIIPSFVLGQNYIDTIKDSLNKNIETVERLQGALGSTTNITNDPEIQNAKNFIDLLENNSDFRTELEKLYNTQLYDFEQKTENLKYEEQLTFSFSPSFPRPNQVVEVKVQGFSSNLNILPISWYVDGVLQKREVGGTKHFFQVGELGQKTTLKFVLEKNNQEKIERTFNFRPAEVDIIYEAQTYTPHLYSGKALFTPQSSVKIIALPQVIEGDTEIAPQNLVYDWYFDRTFMKDVSGPNKQSFYYDAKLLDSSLKIGVEITTMKGVPVAHHTILIPKLKPEVVFYEKNPTQGTTYNKSIFQNLTMTGPEIEIEAVPFYFKKEEVINGNTFYEWFLNNQKISSPNTSSLVFRNENDEDGQSTIGINIKNKTMLQYAKNSFNLVFKEQKKTFGF